MRVLIIGSLAGELGQAARMAMARGARLEQADAPEPGLARLRGDGHFDLVLCDVAHDVAALVRALAAERMAIPVVACGIDADADAAVRAIRAGAREFLPLPADPDLIAAILQAASGESHTLVARDPVMLAAIRRAEQVASADASVLITGESGTGKEVLARHIHRRSRRAGGPFVALNCAAIPDHLLESELFGHEKGAFSGAVARRVGKFEAANGGTLLLDEISEMDVRLQAKLLRAIQEREIDRLGGNAPVRVNVRILATTNRDLPGEVARGTFREDLYFRLNVVTLRIPALRERPGDIAVLAEHFTRHYAEVNGLPQRRLTPAALLRLTNHTWRGNVRELENTLHRAVLLADGAELDAGAIELAPGTACGTAAAGEAPAGAIMAVPTTMSPCAWGGDAVAGLVGRRMDDVERDLILQTLVHTLGNRTHAATILGISIRALRNKLRDYAGQGLAVPPPPAGLAIPLGS
ncbi:sigma-54 interaction domain-containing protein [Rhodovastum atsumiense]|uniref:Sigma-54-dependent Fis family transcriptional regulator n=1 Tax=Rhodovastum atsumiense TaxID=504468 RepID=A0A5M6IW01_9PROT|nr:sigma-54 dependent transcriptional regulator [Rhodovastum atsumiense]KAA5612500.1 sigma-54-dependent Fis family transcriptional regulator [Rhodovastum atsumiense]